MIIFLFGQDGYRLNRGAEQVIASYKKKNPGGFNYFSFNLADKEHWSRFEDSVKTSSFFEEIKLLALRGAFHKDISEKVYKLVNQYGLDKDKAIVVMAVEQFSGKELEKMNKELFRTFSSPSGTTRTFDFLEGSKLINWVRSEFSSRGCNIESAIARNIIDIVGNDSGALANEIEKLANYKQRGEITISDIDRLVSVESELSIFELIDAIASKNKAKAYEMLYREIKSGRDPHYILSMIVFGFRNLLMVKDLAENKTTPALIAKKSGLHPFVVKKASANASKFSLSDLKTSYRKLSDADILGKNGAVNIVDSLFSFVIEN